MKRFSEQFDIKARTVKMTGAEKRALRERVVSYMEYHPLAISKSEIPTPYREEIYLPSFLRNNSWQKLKWALPAIVVMVMGVSGLAERSVPGETLYAVKQVNEDLRSTMVRGSYEKVVWETELLNRRMAEARELASEGKLTEAVEVEMAKAVKEHSDNARKEIESLREVDEDEATMAAIELSTALSVQGSALQNDGVKNGDGSTDLLAEVVEVATKAVEVTTGENNLPAYEKLVAKVESETTRARELLFSIAGTATVEERSDVERRLSDIDLKIVTASGEVGTDEIKAREGLVFVLEQTHKLIVFMMNIDVRASLTVEEVVPVTLTETERIAKVELMTGQASELLLKIEEKLSATTTPAVDIEVGDKATSAIVMIKEAASKSREALALSPKDVLVAEAAAEEAYNLAKDVAKLLLIIPAELTGQVEEEVVPADAGGPTTEEGDNTETNSPEVKDVATTTEEEVDAVTTVN